MIRLDSSINNLSESVIANPDIIDSLLKKNFDLDELVTNANDIGFDIDGHDVEDYLAIKFPPDAPELAVKTLITDIETGTMRELTADEIEAVTGGTVAVGAAVVAVVIAAVAVVVVVSVGVGITVGAGAAIFTVAAVSTSVAASGGGGI